MQSFHKAVGADAHIGPAEQAVFTEIYGEFATSGRADVGIGPYTNLEGQCKTVQSCKIGGQMAGEAGS